MNDLIFLIPLVIFLGGLSGCLVFGFRIWTWGMFKWQVELDEKIARNKELNKVDQFEYQNHQFSYKILRWSALALGVGLLLLILAGLAWALRT